VIDKNGVKHASKGNSNGGQFVSKDSQESDKREYSNLPSANHIVSNYENKFGGVKDRKAQADESNKTSIKEQVKENSNTLSKTKTLATIPKTEIVTDYNKAAQSLKEKLKANDGFVSRKGFGDIQVSSRIFDAQKYVKTPADVAAITAIPEILENGVKIAEHDNHKGRGYSTVTFAGNIKVAGQSGVMAVTVMQTKGNFYKVHRVLTPNGDVLYI